ncbi:MAG: GSCFA domain-containing protein [Solirubrobacteraceae bacterium]
MEFKTNVKIKEYPFKISHKDNIFSIGSCFSDEISKRLLYARFNVSNNPFGVVFHPMAIENSLHRIIKLMPYNTLEIFKNDELYFSWDHSSIFNTTSLEETLFKINEGINEANIKLQKANIFIITLATSWAYRLKKTDKIVSNCHKVPNIEFKKILLTEQEIENALKSTVNLLNKLPQEIKIIFTVSPVRHTRDGLVENSVSKSRLLNAVYNLTQTVENVSYFPSYEILIDELRDYRFFKEDMIHPTQQAVEYIWQKFSESFFTPTTQEMVNKVLRIKKLEEHKPKNTQTIAFKKLVNNTIKEMQELEVFFGVNTFKEEIERIKLTIENAN